MRNSDDETAAESDSDETSSTTSMAESGPAQVDLTLQRLQSLQGMTTADGDPSSFSRNGASRERLADAIKNPCCKCRCKIPLGVLLKIVAAFWMLSKPTQDALLWSLQHEAGPKKKKEWYIAGVVP